MHAAVAGPKAGPPGMVVVVVPGTRVVDVVLGCGVVGGFSVVDVVVGWTVVDGLTVVEVLVGRAVEDVVELVVVVGGNVEDVLVVELVVVVVGLRSGRLAQLVMHEPRADRHSVIGRAGGHPKLLLQ